MRLTAIKSAFILLNLSTKAGESYLTVPSTVRSDSSPRKEDSETILIKRQRTSS